MKKLLSILLIATCVCWSSASSQQSYPNRVVRLIVPFGAGGGTDRMARLFQTSLATSLNASVVVQNKDGAAGTIGGTEIAGSKPDGYTIGLMPFATLAAQPHLGKAKYTLDSFDFVCRLYSSPSLIMVAKNSRFGSLAELINYAKSNPGKLNYATTGTATQPHLLGLKLAEAADATWEYIPYRSDALALTGLLDGSVDVYATQDSFYFANRDHLKVLASVSEARSEALPNVPTAREFGYNVVMPVWAGIVAPKDLPGDILATLTTACKTVSSAPEFVEALKRMQQDVAFLDGPAFAAFVQNESTATRNLIVKYKLAQ